MVRRPASTTLLQAASAPHPVLDSRCTPFAILEHAGDLGVLHPLPDGERGVVDLHGLLTALILFYSHNS